MSGRQPLIMIVEDDEETAQLNMRILKRQGYDVMNAYNAAQARSIARESTPDLFVLDIVLPDGDGISLCKELRQDSDTPVIFLTGKKSTEDKIAGLTGGGDYYLTKPYSIDELIVVVERLLARTEQARKRLVEASVIERGNLKLLIPQRTALVKGRDAGLTSKEFDVLLMLVQNEDIELSNESIYNKVWNTQLNRDTGALRTQVARLKKKLDEENTDDFSILNKHGKGYTFTLK